ncbi:MAG: hypothetical protein ACYSUG_07760 [Planctomycetota bacterium]|jgi:hypothetical protein
MNMKQMVVLMCVVSLGMGALANTFMGPPTAELKPGQWKFAYSYSYAEMDVDAEGDTLEDITLSRHYADIGAGIFEGLELNALLGSVGAEIDADDLDPSATEDFDSSGEFSWGFNAKYTFLDGDTVDWGAMYQMTWFSAEDTVDGVDIEFDDAYDIQIAVGPTIDLGPVDIYGGAFYYMLDGEAEASGALIGEGDIEEESNFGGYVGIQLTKKPGQYEITDGAVLGVEFQFTSDMWGIGGTLGWKF